MERFIIGTGRCGSTLLSKMLAISPEMVSISEFFNGLPSNRRFGRASVGGKELWDILTQPHPFVTIVTSRGFPVEEVVYPFDRPNARFGPDDNLPWLLVAALPHLSDDPDRLFDELREYVVARPPQVLGQHYCDVFDWLARKAGGVMWNERSGSGIDSTADLVRLYPDARFLHIHRAGEEAALSMREHAAFRLAVTLVYGLETDLDFAAAFGKAVPKAGQEDPLRRALERRPAAEYFGRFWSDQLAGGYRVVQHLRPEQYLEVSFDDLIGSSIETLGRIADFFSMDPEAGGWRQKAAALVRGQPPSRQSDLVAADRAALVAACRTGNLLLGREPTAREAFSGVADAARREWAGENGC